MNDENKTKAQLIAELNELRQRNAELQASEVEYMQSGGTREENELEVTLRGSEKRYRALVETIPYGVEDIDVFGNILYANSAQHKLYGFLEGELVGKNILDLLANDAEREPLRDYLEFWLVSRIRG